MEKSFSERMMEMLREGSIDGAVSVQSEAFGYAAHISQLALQHFHPADVAFAIAGMQLYLESFKTILPEQQQQQIDFLLKNTSAMIIDKNGLKKQFKDEDQE